MTATTKRLSARTLVGAQGRVVRPAEPRVVEWHAALSGPQHMPQRASKSSALSMGSTLKRTRLPSYQNLTRAIGEALESGSLICAFAQLPVLPLLTNELFLCFARQKEKWIRVGSTTISACVFSFIYFESI